MSIDLVAACLWLDLPPARKLVLLGLCERASLETGETWPGRDELGMRASLSERSVTPHLAALYSPDGTNYIKRLGPKPWREGQMQRRWLNVDRILTEGQARERWLRDLREQRRLQRRLEEDGPSEEDAAQLVFDVLGEPGEESSCGQGKIEAGEESSPGSRGSSSPPAGEAGDTSRGSSAQLAGEAASPVTVSRTVIEPSAEPSATTDGGERIFVPPMRSGPPGISTSQAGELGARVKAALQGRITSQNFATWLAPTRFEAHGQTLYVTAPSELSADWLRTRLANVLAQAAVGEGLTDVQVFEESED